MTDNKWAMWLKTRPKNVQDAAQKLGFEPGDTIGHDGKVLWFMGYGELDDGEICILVSPISPLVDYKKAVESRQYICPKHLELFTQDQFLDDIKDNKYGVN